MFDASHGGDKEVLSEAQIGGEVQACRRGTLHVVRGRCAPSGALHGGTGRGGKTAPQSGISDGEPIRSAGGANEAGGKM